MSDTVKTITLIGNTVCIKECDFDCLMDRLHEIEQLEKENASALKEIVRLSKVATKKQNVIVSQQATIKKLAEHLNYAANLLAEHYQETGNEYYKECHKLAEEFIK